MPMTTTDDAVIANYLGWLSAAARDLPQDRRTELVDEIAAHIAEARAQGDGGSGQGLLDLLARLGEPEAIVQAASEPPAGFQAPGWHGPASHGAGIAGGTAAGGSQSARAPAAARPGALEIAAVILVFAAPLLLVVGPVLAGASWLAGVILVWYSGRWRTADKVLGTLVWPAVVAVARLSILGHRMLHLSGTGGFPLLARLLVLGLVLALAVSVAVRLLRRATVAA
jgi:hypothetical protein